MNKKPIILGVSIAVLAVGAIAAYQYFFPGGGGMSYNAACAAKDCGWQGGVNVRPRPGEPYPPKCPKCSRGSVFPLTACPRCGNRQLLNEEVRNWAVDMDGKILIPGADKLPNSTKCDKCGGPIKHGD